MASQDLHNNIATDVALDYQSISTDTTTAGNIIDTKGFESVEFVIYSGTITDGDYAPTIQEGDESDLSDASTVSSDFLLGTVSDATFGDADGDASKRIGYVGHKRYVRLSLVSTSTSSGGSLGAVVVKGHPHHLPTE